MKSTSSNRIWIVTEKGIERLTLNVEMTRCSSELILPRSNRNIYSNIIKLDDKIIVSQGEESFITDASNNLSNMPGLLQILDGANCYYSNISKDSDENYWYITGDALKVRRKNPVNGMYDPHPTIVWNRHSRRRTARVADARTRVITDGVNRGQNYDPVAVQLQKISGVTPEIFFDYQRVQSLRSTSISSYASIMSPTTMSL